MTLFRDLADREDSRLMSKQPSCRGLDAVFCVCFFFFIEPERKGLRNSSQKAE